MIARSRALFLLPALVLALPTAAHAQNEPDGTLKLETYLDWEWVGNPQISPDGEEVVFTRTWVDQINDRRTSSIWIMDADGSRARFLVDGSSPSWSPDGTRIAYTAEGEPEGSQIFIRWMDDEGAVTQITRLEKSPSNVSWSPDGTRLAFSMSVASPNPWPISLPGRPEGAQWTEAPKVVDRLQYRRDRRGYIDDGYSHLFVVPADGGTARQLTEGDWNHNGVEWTPDGEQILFTSLRVEDAEHEWRESDIYAVDVDDGQITRLTDRSGPDGSPLPSPDGSLIAYTGYDMTTDTYVVPGIYVMNSDGSGSRLISGDFDRRAAGMIWDEDGQGDILQREPRRNPANLYYASVDGGVREVTSGNHMLSVSSINAERPGGRHTRSSFHEPGDVVSRSTSAIRRTSAS